MLLGNYDNGYLGSIIQKIEQDSYEYRKLYTECYNKLENNANSSVQSYLRNGWTKHCLERMQERDISRADVKNGIATREIIEEYPEDYPNPSCLIFGYTVNNRILHIVAGCDNINIYIIMR